MNENLCFEGNKWRIMMDCNRWGSDYFREHLSQGDIGVDGQKEVTLV